MLDDMSPDNRRAGMSSASPSGPAPTPPSSGNHLMHQPLGGRLATGLAKIALALRTQAWDQAGRLGLN